MIGVTSLQDPPPRPTTTTFRTVLLLLQPPDHQGWEVSIFLVQLSPRHLNPTNSQSHQRISKFISLMDWEIFKLCIIGCTVFSISWNVQLSLILILLCSGNCVVYNAFPPWYTFYSDYFKCLLF